MRCAMTVALAIATVLTGCGGEADDPGATEEPATSASPEPSESTKSPKSSSPRQDQPEPSGTVIRTAASNYGTMLFDESAQAIYLFDRETSDRPRCYGPCADAWPPVLTKGEPQAGRQARPGLLATTERKDGTLQVTYAGHPLYYYAHEGKDQVLCHNVDEFGGTWLVVRPNGEPAP